MDGPFPHIDSKGILFPLRRSDVPISLRWGHFWESASLDVQRCKKADGQIDGWSTVGEAENRPINGRLLSALQALIVELNSDVILN